MQATLARTGACLAAEGILRARTAGLNDARLRRTSADPPATAQSATKEMNIASTSKTITATVLIQLLEDKGVSVDSSISP